MVSYIPTYKDEPQAHGRCELEARRSVHPERMQVGALTSIWQVGVPPAEAQGVDSANSLFYKKVKSNISHGFTYSILLSTIRQQRPGCQQYGNQRFYNSMDLQPMTTSYCRHFPLSPERETFRMISRIPTQRILLSTIRQVDGREYSTFSGQFRRNCMVSGSRLAVSKRVFTTLDSLCAIKNAAIAAFFIVLLVISSELP